jgi:hypothetical protein
MLYLFYHFCFIWSFIHSKSVSIIAGKTSEDYIHNGQFALVLLTGHHADPENRLQRLTWVKRLCPSMQEEGEFIYFG